MDYVVVIILAILTFADDFGFGEKVKDFSEDFTLIVSAMYVNKTVRPMIFRIPVAHCVSSWLISIFAGTFVHCSPVLNDDMAMLALCFGVLLYGICFRNVPCAQLYQFVRKFYIFIKNSNRSLLNRPLDNTTKKKLAVMGICIYFGFVLAYLPWPFNGMDVMVVDAFISWSLVSALGHIAN